MMEFLGTTVILIAMGVMLFLLCFVAPPLLAARKGYRWWLWTIACGLLGLVVLAFLPYANRSDVSEEVNQTRRQIGNIVGAVLSVLGLLGVAAQIGLIVLQYS